MSRARPVKLPNGEHIWFDTNRNGERATAEQLELLATVTTNCDLDELLDANLSQGEVIKKLREALGADPIPTEVLRRRERWRAQRQVQPKCRKCGKEGDSTKHHFVNKWILRELLDYATKWAERSRNTIPMCIDCHRDLHYRGNGPQVSIADCLTDDEKRFAEEALQTLSDERPKLLILIARGDDSVYEARLVKDWFEGKFRVDPQPATEAPHLALVS